MLDEVVRFAREKLITSYDLSEGKLGLVRDVNRANMEALNETYIDDCLVPRTIMIEEVIEAFLLPIYDTGLMQDFILPTVKSKEFELQKAEMEFRNYAITINEYRAKEGKDSVPWGDVPLAPMNIMPLMFSEDETTPAKTGKNMLLKDLKPFKSWTREEKRKAYKQKNYKRLEMFKLFERIVTNYFKAQKDRTLNLFDSFGQQALLKVFSYKI